MEFVSKIVDHIIDTMKESVTRHVGYLICYKKKIQELESEIEELKDEQTRIQGRVDRAKDCGEIIEADVSKWLMDVHNMEDEVGKFLEDKVNENKECFKCWCPNLAWRYRLGKGAKEKKAAVNSLKDKGLKFETLSVGHPAPFPGELQLASSRDYMTFNSRASVFNAIMEALKDSEVNLIGIHGPGGAGKTTLVGEAAKLAKKYGLFDEIVMAVVSQDVNANKIRKQLAPKLNLTYNQDNEDEGKGKLWNILKEGTKKVLVIMDDVWEKLDMEEIGIPIADGGRGCKVLLTTRREVVCQKMEVQKDFPVGVLEEQDAWNLFEKKVVNVPTEVTQSKAKEVCKECGGLPVAIVAVGAALKGKQGHVWHDALYQLKNSRVQEIPDIDQKMYTSLKLSYDYLEQEDAKSCFLLCCLFPEDDDIPIEDLVRYCMALGLLGYPETLEKARNRVQAMVDLLKSSYLLLHGKDENCVKMHDVIRDVAISIAKGKQEGQQWADKQQFLVKHGVQKWPEEGTWKHYTAVSIRSSNIDELPGDLNCPELHTLLLQCRSKDLVDPFFNGMKKLTVLWLSWVDPENSKKLLPSFTNLVNLRMLQTYGYELGDTGMINNLKNNLEILILGGHNIKELPLEIGELTRLRLLDLETCHSLDVIPQGVISKLIRLEELYIPQQFDGWEGSTRSNKKKSNASLFELKSLKYLTTLHIHIFDVTLLPNDLYFENLKKFRISVGRRFWSQYSSSRMLTLEGFRLNPQFNGLIHGAETLRLYNLEGLETLFHETHDRGVSNLKYLEVIDCHDLKYFCSSFCAKRLQQLQELYIDNCKIMEAIVETEKERDEKEPKNMMIDFSQLRRMELRRLPKLKSFFFETERTTKRKPCRAEQSLFNEKVVFPALEKLEIESLPNADIWDKQLLVEKSFCQLKKLTVRNCYTVVNVIPSNMLRQLKNLESLSISDCNSVKSLVEELKTEEISEFSSSVLGKLEHLKKLRLKRCQNMDMIVSNEGIKFPQLSNLELEALPNLKSFYCSKFATQILFNHQVVFSKLKKISIVDIASLTEIHLWNVVSNVDGSLEEAHLQGFGQIKKNPLPSLALRNLNFLTISRCSFLRNLFTHSVASSLEQLLVLSVKSCELMEDVVTNKGEEEAIEINIEFPRLSLLILGNLPNLESFCDANYTFNFPSLKFVMLRQCPKMQTFTSGQARLPETGIILTTACEKKNLRIRDLNRYLKEEETATSFDDLEEDAFQKLQRELLDEGINLHLAEFWRDALDEEFSEFEVDTE